MRGAISREKANDAGIVLGQNARIVKIAAKQQGDVMGIHVQGRAVLHQVSNGETIFQRGLAKYQYMKKIRLQSKVKF